MEKQLWEECADHLLNKLGREPSDQEIGTAMAQAKQRFGQVAARIQEQGDVEKAVAKITRDERYVIQVLEDTWTDVEIPVETLVTSTTEAILAEL